MNMKTLKIFLALLQARSAFFIKFEQGYKSSKLIKHRERTKTLNFL